MESVFSSVNTMWVLIAAALVFFMQAGFAMVETGFTRAKNAGNIIMKNLMDFSIGTPAYWLVGFGIMFAGSGTLFGGIDFMVKGDYSAVTPEGVPLFAFLIFQTVFCATAATIVSGAMAERTKFSAYCVYSLIISAVIYPISGHWIWGGGWLAQLGFHDFAGSTAVHMVGGIASLVGAKIVGPRIGKYSQSGESRAIPGHSLTLGALGVFILWFCWFGFNGGSTVSMEGENIVSAASIFVTTNLAAATAAVVTMIITWFRYKKPDVSMTLNGALAGLVAITAGCDVVSPFGAFCIGIVAAFVIVFGIEFVDKVLKVDDPVGAVGVHGFSGALGTILTGVFATGFVTEIHGEEVFVKGLAYGGGFGLLGTQALGVVSVIAWVTVTMGIVFTVIKKTMGLRVSHVEELAGLDITEHNLTSSYADFMITPAGADFKPYSVDDEEETVPVAAAIPVVNNSKPGAKMTKITIITNQNKLTALHNALDRIGITGLTVTNVLGHGMQKGHTEYYRGAPVTIKLLPKVQVDIVVCKIPPQTVIDTVKKVLYTGRVGDGKMFVYDVENVVKVRTGEQGYDALQDNE